VPKPEKSVLGIAYTFLKSISLHLTQASFCKVAGFNRYGIKRNKVCASLYWESGVSAWMEMMDAAVLLP